MKVPRAQKKKNNNNNNNNNNNYYYYYYYYTAVDARLFFHVVKKSQVRNSHGSPKECTTTKFSSLMSIESWEIWKISSKMLRKARSAKADLTLSTCNRPRPSDRSWCVEAMGVARGGGRGQGDRRQLPPVPSPLPLSYPHENVWFFTSALLWQSWAPP